MGFQTWFDSAQGISAEFSSGPLLSLGFIACGSISGVLLAFIEIASDGRWTQDINVPFSVESERS